MHTILYTFKIIVKDKVNKNGEKLIEWINKYNLVLLNNDIECDGKYTREARNCRTVIDYAIANEAMYQSFVEMKIDENKVTLDISDHMMLTVTFLMTTITIMKTTVNFLMPTITFLMLQHTRY